MTIYEYIENVRLSVNEENTEHLSDEKIVVFLRRGVRDALALTSIKFDNFLYKNDTVVLTSDIINIPLECQSYRVKGVRVYDSANKWQDLEEKTVEDLSWLRNLQTDVPRYYVILHKKVQVFPYPSRTINSELTYAIKTKELDIPFGKITNIIGNKIYIEDMRVNNSTGDILIYDNNYISITNSISGENIYNYRIKSYSVGDGYIEIFTGVSGYALGNIDATNKYFEFSGTPSFSNIIAGDILTITGSNNQDGIYTIIGVDSTNFRLYVKETVGAVTTVTGTGSITHPSSVAEQIIYDDTSVLTPYDYVMDFNKSAVFDLPEVYQDYICQHATISSLTELKEPITDEQTKLIRLAQIIESEPTNRKGQFTFKVRNVIGRMS